MKKVLRILVPWLVIGADVYFFAGTLIENWHNIEARQFQFNGWAVVGMVFFVGAVTMSGILWGRLLQRLSGTDVSASDAVRIHAASWLLKYVPGQVGSLINKLAWARRNGISQKTTTTSFIYENVLTVLASVVLSLPLVALLAEASGFEISLIVPLLLVIPMVIIVYRPVFYGLLNAVFKKLGRKPFHETDFLATRHLIMYWLAYLVPRILTGAGFVFVAQSLLPIDPSMYVGLAAMYVFASVVGLLAIFVPGGIGVREAVIVAFASVYFPIEQAIVLSLVARLYATIADLGVGGVYLILNKGRIRQR